MFVYPPSSSVCIFNKLCTILQLANPARFLFYVLLGDFNVNYLNKTKYLFPYIKHILCTYSLSQTVPSYTRVSSNGASSLIDLAMLSDTEHLQCCSTIPPLSNSDYLGILLGLKETSLKSSTKISRFAWLYKYADFTKGMSTN